MDGSDAADFPCLLEKAIFGLKSIFQQNVLGGAQISALSWISTDLSEI